MRRRAFPFTCLLGLVLFCAPARGAISNAHLIDGPSADVLALGGIAMSEDGSAGLVYLKRVDGHAHVFASRFDGRRWSPPERVDAGQRFESAWPVIGAGDRGRLVVVWAQDFGSGTDRLFSASLDPGATSFQPPVAIDFDIGEDTATYPSIAMNRGGQALLAYRYQPDVNPDPTLPPGYVNGDVRLARYNGSVWTSLGQPADRNSAAPVRVPTAGNSPKVGIDVTGAGLVAWQEIDDDFVDRIWARRLFPSGTIGIPLPVSPARWAGRPLRGPADEFRMDEAGFGEAGVVFRQQPGQGGAFTSARTMLNEIPDQFSLTAGRFNGPRLVDGRRRTGPGPGTGAGSASVGVDPEGGFLVTQGVGSAAYGVTGDEQSVHRQFRLDDGSGSAPPDPVADVSLEHASATAWRGGPPDDGEVVLREGRSDGVVTTSTAYAPDGGPVDDVELSGSGLGDAAIAFRQGGRENGQVMAAVIDAPPASFTVHTPIGFVRSRHYTVGWDPAPNGIGPVRYTVTVDDLQVGTPTRGLSLRLGPDDLPDGRHKVRIVATDAQGQQTVSNAGDYPIDRRAPRIELRRRGMRVTVTVSDGKRHRTSRVDRGSVEVHWGDGHTGSGGRKLEHRFKHRGRYRIAVRASDKAGNARALHRTVVVR